MCVAHPFFELSKSPLFFSRFRGVRSRKKGDDTDTSNSKKDAEEVEGGEIRKVLGKPLERKKSQNKNKDRTEAPNL